ncbi:MAG: diguanylate cyclase [Eubacterium sp.]
MSTFFWINLAGNVSLWLLIIVVIVALFIYLVSKNKNKYEKMKKSYGMNMWLISTMLNFVHDCVILIDETGNIIKINKKVEEYYKKPADKIIGKNVQRFHIDFDYEKHRNSMKERFEFGDVYKVIVNYFTPENNVVPFDVEIHQFIVKGEEIYYGIVAHDIKKSRENEDFIYKQQEKLKEIEHFAKLGFWEINHQNKQVNWSRELYSIFGYEVNTVKPNLDMLFSMVHVGDRNRVTKAFLDAFQNQKTIDIHHRLVNTKDEIVEVIVRIRHTFSENNEHLSTIGIVQDITEEKELRDSLNFQTRFSKAILDNSDILVLTIKEDDIILDANPFIEELTGVPKEELIGQPAAAIFGQVNKRYMRQINAINTPSRPIQMFDKDGHMRYILWNTRELTYLKEERVRVSIGLDVTEGAEYRQKFEHLAYHEPITDLPNRRKLSQVLERYFEKNSGKKDKNMALLFIDLTCYKDVNDLYGYTVGDALVKKVCDRLKDEIGHYGLLARHSDDLLVLFLPNRNVQEKIESICFDVIRILNLPCRVNDTNLVMGGQVGVAKYPEDADSMNDLLRFADAALNCARKDPTIDYYFFDDALKEKLSSSIRMHKN